VDDVLFCLVWDYAASGGMIGNAISLGRGGMVLRTEEELCVFRELRRPTAPLDAADMGVVGSGALYEVSGLLRPYLQTVLDR